MRFWARFFMNFTKDLTWMKLKSITTFLVSCMCSSLRSIQILNFCPFKLVFVCLNYFWNIMILNYQFILRLTASHLKCMLSIGSLLSLLLKCQWNLSISFGMKSLTDEMYFHFSTSQLLWFFITNRK